MKKYSSSRRRPHAAPAARRVEVIVPEGLEPLARRELRRLGPGARLEPGEAPGVIAMSYGGELRPLLGLRSVTSVYLAHAFPVPRPKALLGDEQFRAAVAACEAAIRLHPAGSFRTLFLSAAGV
jgi:tRNA (guanine6-N2)-methyltransferase